MLLISDYGPATWDYPSEAERDDHLRTLVKGGIDPTDPETDVYFLDPQPGGSYESYRPNTDEYEREA